MAGKSLAIFDPLPVHLEILSASRNSAPPMASSPRCGAKMRSGMPCTAAAVSGKKRCRIHGGAPGSGAPLGNKNALKQGLHTREAIAEHRRLQALLRQARRLVQGIE
jgi:hypothetical protein